MEDVLAVRRATLGDEHEHTLQSIKNLAHLMLSKGDHDAALSLGRLLKASAECCPTTTRQRWTR